MKKLFRLVILLAVVSPAASNGATVSGTLLEINGDPTSAERIRFVPPPGPVTIGTNVCLDYPRVVNLTNGAFSTYLAGGFYDANFYPATQRPIRILVPPNDTNTYTFNQVAQLAVNAGLMNFITVSNAIDARTVTNGQSGVRLEGPFYIGGTNTVTLTISNNANVANIVPDAGGLNIIGPLFATYLAGDGVNVSNLNANFLATGTVPLSRLPANQTNDLRQVVQTGSQNLTNLSSVATNQIVYQSGRATNLALVTPVVTNSVLLLTNSTLVVSNGTSVTRISTDGTLTNSGLITSGAGLKVAPDSGYSGNGKTWAVNSAGSYPGIDSYLGSDRINMSSGSSGLIVNEAGGATLARFSTDGTFTNSGTITAGTGLRVNPNSGYAGLGRPWFFNYAGGLYPSIDSYAGFDRINLSTDSRGLQFTDGGSTAVLNVLASNKTVEATGVMKAAEYFGSAQAMKNMPPNPMQTGLLSPRPHIGWSLADWDGTTLKTTESMVTNHILMLKTNGWLTTMSNMNIRTIINIDSDWQGSNRTSLGFLTSNPTAFPSGIPYIIKFIQTNGYKASLSIYFWTNWVPGQTLLQAANFGDHFKEVAMTADTMNKDIGWFYTNNVDNVRMQDANTYDYYGAANLSRAVGTSVLYPALGLNTTAFAWNYGNPNDNLTNIHPMSTTVLSACFPPSPEFWNAANVMAWDGGWPTDVNIVTLAGARYMFTNVVPYTSLGHWYEPVTMAHGASAAADRASLSQLATFSASLNLFNKTNNPPFGDAGWQSMILNTNFLRVHQDVEGVPTFKARNVFDNGPGGTSMYVKNLSNDCYLVWSLNEVASSQTVSATFAAMGINSNMTYSVTDVWNNTNGGEYFTGFTNLVQASDCTLFILRPIGIRHQFLQSSQAPTAAQVGGTVGSVTNHMIKAVNGVLIDYWSDGTTLYSKQLAP